MVTPPPAPRYLGDMTAPPPEPPPPSDDDPAEVTAPTERMEALPPEPSEPAEPTAATQPLPPARRGLLLEALTLATATAGGLAALGHGLASRPPRPPPPVLPEPIQPVPVETVSALLGAERYWHPERTDGRLRALVRCFCTIFTSPPDRFFYYSIRGDLRDVPLPQAPSLEEMADGERQGWHNANRLQVAVAGTDPRVVLPEDIARVGYPFGAIPRITGTVDGKEEALPAPPLEIVEARLYEPVWGEGYLGGEELPLVSALERIAAALDVPLPLVLGLGATESGFHQGAVSAAGARGLFQFLEGTAEMHRDELRALHPPLRTRTASPTEEWQNRFVQAELLCHHYRYLRDKVRPQVEALTARLRVLDPGLDLDLTVLAILTAYNGGPGLVERCVSQFVARSDAELTACLGEAPLGWDVWLALLGTSYGERRVGLHVLTYPFKVLAWAGLLWGGRPLLGEGVVRPPPPPHPPPPISPRERAQTATAAVGGLAAGGLLALAGVGLLGGRVSRRDLLVRGLPSAAGLGVLSTIPLCGPPPPAAEIPEAPSLPPPPPSIPAEVLTPALEAVLGEARAALTWRHGQLCWRRAHDMAPDEARHQRQYLMPVQEALLAPSVERWFGADYVERFARKRRTSLRRLKPLFEEGAALQMQNPGRPAGGRGADLPRRGRSGAALLLPAGGREQRHPEQPGGAVRPPELPCRSCMCCGRWSTTSSTCSTPRRRRWGSRGSRWCRPSPRSRSPARSGR